MNELEKLCEAITSNSVAINTIVDILIDKKIVSKEEYKGYIDKTVNKAVVGLVANGDNNNENIKTLEKVREKLKMVD